MSRPSFLEGALVALASAVVASVGYSALRVLLPASQALTLVIAALGFSYLLYLLVRSREPAGRVLLFLVWLVATGATLALIPGPPTQTAIQLGLIWIGRIWCFQRTPLAALADLGLILAGGLAALWAIAHTGSLFLAVWSLMLIQALFTALPALSGCIPDPNPQAEPAPFDLPRRAAENALSRIETRA